MVTNQMSGGTLISLIIYELELGEALEVWCFSFNMCVHDTHVMNLKHKVLLSVLFTEHIVSVHRSDARCWRCRESVRIY